MTGGLVYPVHLMQDRMDVEASADLGTGADVAQRGTRQRCAAEAQMTTY